MKLALAFLLIASSPAASISRATNAPLSPLLGTWEVDVARLPVPREARPKRVTIQFRAVPAGRWTTRVDIVGGDGSRRHMTSTYVPDGTPAVVEGDTAEADVTAVRLPAKNVMVLALGKAGIPASTRIYNVGSSGVDMTETSVYFSDDGKPLMRTNYFRRVR